MTRPSQQQGGLRARVMRGGAFLVGRQAMGMVISLVGVVLVTREIGPAAYGLFAATLAIFTFTFLITRWGIDLYLVRAAESDHNEERFDIASTLLLAISLLGLLAGLASLPLLSGWVGLENFQSMMAVYFLMLPVAMLAAVPRAKLERDLAYDKLAIAELITLIQFQSVAVLLAYLGWGAWSLTLSWVMNQFLGAGITFGMARYRPRLNIDRPVMRDMLGHGTGYTASMCTNEARTLINPLIIAPFAGPQAVGYVGMVVQLITRLSIIRMISQQMSVAALAKVQEQRDKIRDLLGEGMQLHVICVGLPVLIFVLVSPWLVPTAFGERWRPMVQLLPYVGTGAVAMGLFSLHASVLYMYRRAWRVASFHVLWVGVMFAASYVLVKQIGWLGYGWAELASIPTYFVLHRITSKVLGGSPRFAVPLGWAMAISLLMFFQTLGWWSLTGVGLLAIWPASWREIAMQSAHLQKLRRSRRPVDEERKPSMPQAAKVLPLILVALLGLFPMSAQAREIHVSPEGSDNAVGTAEDPLRTLARAAVRARAGDVVILHEGLYQGRFRPPRSGEADRPITYRSVPTGIAIVDATDQPYAIKHEGSTYIHLEGIVFRNAVNGVQAHQAMVQPGDHWVLKDCIIENALGAGLGIRQAKHVTVQSGEIRGNGQIGLAVSDSRHVTIRDVKIHGNNPGFISREALLKGGADPGIALEHEGRWHINSAWEAGGTKFHRTTHLLLDGVEAYENFGPGIWLDYKNTHATIRNCTARNNRNLNEPWQGVGIFIEYNPESLIEVVRNSIQDNEGIGLLVAESSQVNIERNRMTNDELEFRDMVRDSPSPLNDIAVTHNRFDQSRIQTSLGDWSRTATKIKSLTIRNNAFIGKAIYRYNDEIFEGLTTIQKQLGFEIDSDLIDPRQ
jgi:PST family polysaccharide transporter